MIKNNNANYTYKKSGVDIEMESIAIRNLSKHLSFIREDFGTPINIGDHFTGLISFGDYVLSLNTDGVGTKILIASAMKKWDTIGIDCIAMNVNDTICIGATPLAFVDYIAVEKIDIEIFNEIGIGLNEGAKLANISIIGGETATLNEIINGFDLAGTCLGYAKKENIITGHEIKVGDVVIGLRSSGIHSNGLTLARNIFQNNGYNYDDTLDSIDSIGIELLKPTKIYVKEILNLINNDYQIHGMANITGGGLKNLNRLKPNYSIKITNMFDPQPIFNIIQEMGNVKDHEMYRTFNMGLGFVVIADKMDADDIIDDLKSQAQIIGVVEEGSGVHYNNMDF